MALRLLRRSAFAGHWDRWRSLRAQLTAGAFDPSSLQAEGWASVRLLDRPAGAGEPTLVHRAVLVVAPRIADEHLRPGEALGNPDRQDFDVKDRGVAPCAGLCASIFYV